MSRRLFLAAASSGLASGALAKAPAVSLRPFPRPSGFHKRATPAAEAIIAKARLGGTVSFAVVDLDSGAGLESLNPQKGTPPASVTKAVTALYALDILGADHRFSTKVIATGPVTDGILDGDLVLAGGGDPTLDSTDLANLAAEVKAMGIHELRGKFLVWDAALPRVERIDPDQPDHVGYNPAVSGIALNFNRVHFEWRRGQNGYSVTMDARTAEYRPDVATARMQIVSRSLPIYTYASTPERDEWTVARKALGKGGARWLPVRLPGLYAGDVFRTMARSHGIKLPAARIIDTLPAGRLIAAKRSAPLQDILRDMLKYSNNLTAEMVGLAATIRRSGHPADLQASAQVMNRWAAEQLGMSDVRLVDHSGLGDESAMTAQDMCAALVRMRGNGFRALLKQIPMRDGNGRPQATHPVRVDAKTGTLNFVSTLAGYMTAPDGRELAFAIFTADEQARARIPRANREAPEGARSWNARSKALQQALIERWAVLYGS
ncbi:D-alanyl-D-alanine carboxypeptidase/D-alanyl-D-alanine endopeptidase [Aliishimia ponticola]